MSKHTPEHAPSCPRNIDWDAASLCDKDPECTCGLGKHTPEAVKTAEHINERQAVIFGRDTWDVDELAGLIDRETDLPALQARIDCLEADKAELFDLIRRAGIHVRHCSNCSEYVLDIVKEARAIYAKTEPREGMG